VTNDIDGDKALGSILGAAIGNSIGNHSSKIQFSVN
jgi:hypothetical protein